MFFNIVIYRVEQRHGRRKRRPMTSSGTPKKMCPIIGHKQKKSQCGIWDAQFLFFEFLAVVNDVPTC